MAKKNDKFYFDTFVEAASYSCQAAEFLVKCFEEYNPDNLPEYVATMHGFEHAADGKKHEVSAALAKAFVTPIDREDLALMSQSIDDVADSLEEVLQGFYIYGIETVLPEAKVIAAELVQCCAQMKEMLEEFGNFKKPAKLRALCIEINNREETCDRLYMSAMRAIRTHCDDPLDVVSWREIYDKLENCADACEHVGDCVETVVMKNT